MNVFLDLDIEWEVGCPAITNLHSLSRKIDGGSKLFINVKKKISLKDIFHILYSQVTCDMLELKVTCTGDFSNGTTVQESISFPGQH